MDVDPGLSVETIDEKVSQHFGWDTHEAAEGILRVAFNNMANAIRGITVERGYDPRNFTMFAYGGAGPLHAGELANELDVPRVLIPRHPGVGSAFGVASPDYRFDYLRPVLKKTETVNVDGLNQAYDEMIEELEADLNDVGMTVQDDTVTVERMMDMRYYGQVSSLSININKAEITDETIESVANEFEEEFESEFGYTLPENVSEVEFVNARLVASAAQERIEPRIKEIEGSAQKGNREVWFSGKTYSAPIYDRDRLNLNDDVEGPAVIEQSDTTIVVPPNGDGAVDQYGNFIITLS